jgi:hypothetical protein
MARSPEEMFSTPQSRFVDYVVANTVPVESQKFDTRNCRVGSIITSFQFEVFVPVAALALEAFDYYDRDEEGGEIYDTYQERVYKVGYMTDIFGGREVEEFASFSYGTKSGFELTLSEEAGARPVSEFRAEDIVNGLLRYKNEKGRKHYHALRATRLFHLPHLRQRAHPDY